MATAEVISSSSGNNNNNNNVGVDNNSNNGNTQSVTTTTNNLLDVKTEYQHSYTWKLQMINNNKVKPKELSKTEYQREFTWKDNNSNTTATNNANSATTTNNNNNNNLISSTSSTPIPPSPIPPSPIPPSPIPPPTSSSINNISNDLSRLRLTSKSTPSLLQDIARLSDDNCNNNTSSNIKHNGCLVTEPDDTERISYNNNKWQNELRKSDTLESKYDPQTKKIIALEADRLSKKSRTYSMYSLHDQLKTVETANILSDPLESEYKRNFVNWKVYGTESREDAYLNNKEAIDLTSNTPGRIGHNRRRRGSWSASTLPATLKWLEDININKSSSSSHSTRDNYNKNQSSGLNNVTDNSRGYEDNKTRKMMPKRPTTSAEFRVYGDNNNSDRHLSSNYYHYEDGSRNYSKDRPLSTTVVPPEVLNKDPYYYNGSGTRETIGGGNVDSRRYYNYDDPDNNNNNNNARKLQEKNHAFGEYYVDNSKRNDRFESSISLHDDLRKDYREMDNNNGYYKDAFDHRYNKNNINNNDNRKNYIDGNKKYRDDIIADSRQPYNNNNNNNYNYSINNNVNNKYPSDNYYFETSSRREKNQYAHNSNNNSIDLQHNIGGHSRNTSYASSNKSSIHEEQLQQQKQQLHLHNQVPMPSHLDAFRHRNSASSNSSASTPSSPATPNYYETNDLKWNKNSLSSPLIEPQIYKDQLYTNTLNAKYNTQSPQTKVWDNEKDAYFQQQRGHYDDFTNMPPNPPSSSRNKFYPPNDDDRYYYDDVASNNNKGGKRQPYTSSSSKGVSGDPYNMYNNGVGYNSGRVGNNNPKHSASSTPRSYNSMYSTPTPRSTSPTRDLYSSKKYNSSSNNNNQYSQYNHNRIISSPPMSPTYSSRPPSRATSVSSHATSIEEESAILTDILKEADNATLRSLTDQLGVFSQRNYNISSTITTTKKIRSNKSGGGNSTSSTTSSVSSSKKISISGSNGTKNSTKLSTTTGGTTGKKSTIPNNGRSSTTPSSRNAKMPGITSRSTGIKNHSAPTTPGIGTPGKKKVPKISSGHSTPSFRSDIRSGASTPGGLTDFAAAREALARARLQVEQMLEIVDNGGTID